MAERQSRLADSRITVAAAATLLIVSLCVGVLLSRQGAERFPAALPSRCLGLWNASPTALIAGYHNFHRHRYREAEILRLGAGGRPAAKRRCAVVFPSPELDREPRAGAKVLVRGRWMPLSETLGSEGSARISELQFAAIAAANAALRPDGTLAGL